MKESRPQRLNIAGFHTFDLLEKKMIETKRQLWLPRVGGQRVVTIKGIHGKFSGEGTILIESCRWKHGFMYLSKTQRSEHYK